MTKTHSSSSSNGGPTLDVTIPVGILLGKKSHIAGSLGRKQRVPASAGTFPTATPLFATLLFGVVIIVVGLTYFPVVSLGPVVEHLVGKF